MVVFFGFVKNSMELFPVISPDPNLGFVSACCQLIVANLHRIIVLALESDHSKVALMQCMGVLKHYVVSPLARAVVKSIIAFAAFTAIGLLYAVQIQFILERSNRSLTLELLLTGPLTFWYTWGAFLPIIAWIARRLPLERGRLTIRIPVHAGLGVLFAFAHQAIYFLIREAFADQGTAAAPLLSRIEDSAFSPIFTTNVIIYWMMVFGRHALEYYHRYKDRERAATAFQAQLVQAQLQNLRMQLHPHFLFNTLHTISSLMDEDVRAARRMMSRLSQLLRHTLEKGETPEVTLGEELEMLRLYLDIEGTRFQDRLRLKFEVDEKLMNACVPTFILQPLAENAIRHGIAQRSIPGEIRIAAEQQNGELIVSVQNDGPDEPSSEVQSQGSGIGLSNTRSRLAQLYGENQALEVLPINNNGTLVRLRIPMKTPAPTG